MLYLVLNQNSETLFKGNYYACIEYVVTNKLDTGMIVSRKQGVFNV